MKCSNELFIGITWAYQIKNMTCHSENECTILKALKSYEWTITIEKHNVAVTYPNVCRHSSSLEKMNSEHRVRLLTPSCWKFCYKRSDTNGIYLMQLVSFVSTHFDVHGKNALTNVGKRPVTFHPVARSKWIPTWFWDWTIRVISMDIKKFYNLAILSLKYSKHARRIV